MAPVRLAMYAPGPMNKRMGFTLISFDFIREHFLDFLNFWHQVILTYYWEVMS